VRAVPSRTPTGFADGGLKGDRAARLVTSLGPPAPRRRLGRVDGGGDHRRLDWEYTRLGDPADEIAYAFDQNALAPSQRRTFWGGYRQGLDSPSRLARIIERADWWEPVTLLGSALWWVERWVRRTERDTEGNAHPTVPRGQECYFDHAMSRIDRLESLVAAS
jgi:hypothetical protein